MAATRVPGRCGICIRLTPARAWMSTAVAAIARPRRSSLRVIARSAVRSSKFGVTFASCAPKPIVSAFAQEQGGRAFVAGCHVRGRLEHPDVGAENRSRVRRLEDSVDFGRALERLLDFAFHQVRPAEVRERLEERERLARVARFDRDRFEEAGRRSCVAERRRGQRRCAGGRAASRRRRRECFRTQPAPRPSLRCAAGPRSTRWRRSWSSCARSRLRTRSIHASPSRADSRAQNARASLTRSIDSVHAVLGDRVVERGCEVRAHAVEANDRLDLGAGHCEFGGELLRPRDDVVEVAGPDARFAALDAERLGRVLADRVEQREVRRPGPLAGCGRSGLRRRAR